MSIPIEAQERDSLYERVLIRLNGIDAVYRAVQKEDWSAAHRLGQEFSDLLRLVCSDLGWGVRMGESISLSAPPDVLSRALRSVEQLAEADLRHFEFERQDAESQEHAARYLLQTCKRIQGQLPPTTTT